MNPEPQPLPTNRPEHEVVLPNGVFFKLRRINWLDWINAMNSGSNYTAAIVLAHRCGTFDGEARTIEQLQQMDIEDFMPIVELINKQFFSAHNKRGGIA